MNCCLKLNLSLPNILPLLELMKISKKAGWEEVVLHIRKVSRFDAIQVPCSTDGSETGMQMKH